MYITTNEIRAGAKVELDNEPYLVLSINFIKPGKGQAFNKIKIKNMVTGRVLEKTYKSGEKLAVADVNETKMRLLYIETDNAVFMNDSTFEQLDVSFDVLKDKVNWLKEDCLYDMILYKENIIEVIPPIFMELKIINTEPGFRGNTASGKVLKPATLETNAVVQVPIFIDNEETIKVDTRTSEYVSRA